MPDAKVVLIPLINPNEAEALLAGLHVQEGDEVKQGDVRGTVGSTGRSTGPHLDWRVNLHKVRLDPALLLE